jgi:hypothetical protein
LIAAGVGATVGGLEMAGVGQPSTPKASDPTKLTPLTAGQNASQTATVGQQLPNLQSLTGGSLSPEYAAQFGALQSGLGNDPQASGNIQSAINQFFGLNAPGQTGLTPSSTATTPGGGSGILDLLKMPGSGGGGSGTPGMSGGGGYGSWIQQQLQGNNFQGLGG